MGAALTNHHGPRIGFLSRIRNAVHPSFLFNRPKPGRIVVADNRIDDYMKSVSDGLNMQKLKGLLQSADSGDLAGALVLFEEMQQKDPGLSSVVETRCNALTLLEYEVVSAAESEDVKDQKQLADEAADYVRNQLSKIPSLIKMFDHLSTAIGSNLAVIELIWEGNRIVDAEVVPSNRLRIDPRTPGVVRVITADDHEGIPATGPKWIVHTPRSVSGSPIARSLFRAQAYVYLIKILSLADWATFTELFGMPIRTARYEPNATPEEKQELMDMLKNMGSKAFGIFSKAVDMEIRDVVRRNTGPYKELIDWCEKAQAKLFLGANLTSDTTGGTGTLSTAVIHNEVREDLRDSDIVKEGHTLRQQLIAPIVFYRFWREVPLPYFKRKKPEVVDRIQEANLIREAMKGGMKVSKKWAHKRLDIPEPKEDEEVLKPLDTFFDDSVTEGFGNGAA